MNKQPPFMCLDLDVWINPLRQERKQIKIELIQGGFVGEDESAICKFGDVPQPWKDFAARLRPKVESDEAKVKPNARFDAAGWNAVRSLSLRIKRPLVTEWLRNNPFGSMRRA